VGHTFVPHVHDDHDHYDHGHHDEPVMMIIMTCVHAGIHAALFSWQLAHVYAREAMGVVAASSDSERETLRRDV
jgi:hypothetical protein